jgi:uncharacterized membrane protein
VVSWDDYVHLALDEVRHFGARSIQVIRRMRWLLLDLKDVAPAVRQAVLDEELSALDEAAREHFPRGTDANRASEPDARGIA